MSNLAKLLLVVAILTSGGSAALCYFLNKQKTQYEVQLSAVETQLKKSPSLKYQSDFHSNMTEPATTIEKMVQNLETTEKDLESNKTELTEAQNVIQSVKTQKEQIESDLTQTRKEIEDTKNQLTEAQEKSESLSRQLDDLNTSLKGESPKSLMDKIEKTKADLNAARTEKKILEDKVAELDSKLINYQQRQADMQKTDLPENLSGKIVAYNKAWGFVVLDIGRNQKLTEGVELSVHHGTNVIGKVKTVSVDATTAVADILPHTLNGEIQVGDEVSF